MHTDHALAPGAEPDSAAALILGAAVWPDGPSPTLRRRTLHGAALFHAGKVGHLVPCGGLGRHPPPEALVMAALLRDAGVPADRIHPESSSASTAQNIALALPILTRLGLRDVVIVTDLPHAPRALLVARRHGLRARASCPSLRGASPGALLRLTLREVPAYLAYLLRLRG